MKILNSIFIFVLPLFIFTIISCDNEPYEGEFPTNDVDLACVDATANLSIAAANYASVTSSDPNYTDICNAYAIALQNQISACGDADGSLQDIIDGLNCTIMYLEGDYWPRAIGNSWTYNIENSGVETYAIVATETFDGIEYYAFNQFFGNPTWIRKSGPNYYLKSQFIDINDFGFTTTPFILHMINDAVLVGETWESNVIYTISYDPPGVPDEEVSYLYRYEMKERDIIKTVAGQNYGNVIHIEITANIDGQNIIMQYYYAKGIGMIYNESPSGTKKLLEYSLN